MCICNSAIESKYIFTCFVYVIVLCIWLYYKMNSIDNDDFCLHHTCHVYMSRTKKNAYAKNNLSRYSNPWLSNWKCDTLPPELFG